MNPNGKRFWESPCFNFQSLPDSLNNAGLTWRYYTGPFGNGFQWCELAAIDHIRNGRQWNTNVLTDSRFSQDVAAGTLANMTWITTGGAESEHPQDGSSCVHETKITLDDQNGLFMIAFIESAEVIS